MDLTSLGPEKRKKYLLVILPVIIAGIIYLVWNYFLAKPAPVVLEPIPPPEIRINFEVFEAGWCEGIPICGRYMDKTTCEAQEKCYWFSFLKEAKLFEEISPFEGEIGRENPFIPYYEIKPAE